MDVSSCTSVEELSGGLISRGQISLVTSKLIGKKRRLLSQSKKPIQGLAQRIRFRALSKCRKVGAKNWGNKQKKLLKAWCSFGYR